MSSRRKFCFLGPSVLLFPLLQYSMRKLVFSFNPVRCHNCHRSGIFSSSVIIIPKKRFPQNETTGSYKTNVTFVVVFLFFVFCFRSEAKPRHALSIDPLDPSSLTITRIDHPIFQRRYHSIQYDTKRNETKQNETNQNKSKQNKTKRNKNGSFTNPLLDVLTNGNHNDDGWCSTTAVYIELSRRCSLHIWFQSYPKCVNCCCMGGNNDDSGNALCLSTWMDWSQM